MSSLIYLTNTEPLYTHVNNLNLTEYSLKPFYDTIIAVTGGPKCFTFAEMYGDEKTNVVYFDIDENNLKYKKDLWNLVYKEGYNLNFAIQKILNENLNLSDGRIYTNLKNNEDSVFFRKFHSMEDIPMNILAPSGLQHSTMPGLSGVYFNEPTWKILDIYNVDSMKKYFEGHTLIYISNILDFRGDEENIDWYNKISNYNVDIVSSSIPDCITQLNNKEKKYYINPHSFMINIEHSYKKHERKINKMDDFTIYVVDTDFKDDFLCRELSYNILENCIKNYRYKFFKNMQEAYNALDNESREFVIFVQPGVYCDFEKLVEDVEDEALIGHILDNKENYYEAHPQTVILNVNKWDRAGRPPINYSKEIELMEPIRSRENFHDDYTPLWIKPSDKYKTYKPTYPFALMINSFLCRDSIHRPYIVRPFNHKERKTKSYIYNSLTHKTFKRILAERPEFVKNSAYDNNLKNKEEKLQRYEWRNDLYEDYIKKYKK